MKVIKSTTYTLELNELAKNYLLIILHDSLCRNPQGDLANFARQLEAELS